MLASAVLPVPPTATVVFWCWFDGRVPQTHDQLAFVLLHAADQQNASDFFEEAIRIHGDWLLLTNEMAWILATSHDPERRDPPRAKKLALQTAKQTNFANANILDTLAAAYARSGDFVSAVETARQGLSILGRGPDTSLAKDMRNRIRLYERERPYVAPQYQSQEAGSGER